MSSQAVYLSLGLLSMTGLAGMGVAVGSGVAMMSMAAEEEAKANQSPKGVANSPVEKTVVPKFVRGFAASSL